MKIKFKNWNCTLVASYYSNEKRKAMMLVENGEIVAVATVNMPDYPCEKDQVYVKNYSENRGILQTLINNKIVFPNLVNELGGRFVNIPLMRLTPKALELWNK